MFEIYYGTQAMKMRSQMPQNSKTRPSDQKALNPSHAAAHYPTLFPPNAIPIPIPFLVVNSVFGLCRVEICLMPRSNSAPFPSHDFIKEH
jgi:hypothetical protein